MTGKVKGPEYDSEFRSLLHQFTTCKDFLPQFNLDKFMTEFQLEHCQSAKMRIKEGRSNYKGEDQDKNMGQRVFDITTKFI